MPAVQLEGPVAKFLWTCSAALQLEQEAESGAQQVVEVVDRKRGERVGVKRRGRPAAKSRHQLLLEQPLACFVQHAQLARLADEVGELIEQARANAVKGADPNVVERADVRSARGQLAGDAQAQLLRGAIAERDREYPFGGDTLLDQPAKTLGGGERLAGARAGGDQERPLRSGVGRGGLLSAEDWAADSSRAHSGGAPPYGHTAACGQLPKRVTHVPGSSRGAGSK